MQPNSLGVCLTSGVDFQVDPEPSPQEREALARALDVLLEDPAPPGAWWRRGVEEQVLDELAERSSLDG